MSLAVATMLALGCGETSTGGSGGTAGTGGSAGAGGTAGMDGTQPPPPPSVDESCRNWCANEPEGFSCFEGTPESVQNCYRDCLTQYQSAAARECGGEWIAIKDCELEEECEDLFGDCDSLEDDVDECYRVSSNREYCEANCPQLDIRQCEQDTNECQAVLRADGYCTANCPTQDREDCLEQHISTGTCEYADATNACRMYCQTQNLTECVEQWLAGQTCEFDGPGACALSCPGFPNQGYCAQYWEENGECPDSLPPGPTCISPPATMCMNGGIDSIEPCCVLPAPPNVPNACTGNESVDNPASCTATGTSITHQLTVLEILGDCNAGYDLDSCNGSSCIGGGLAPGEGTGGVDNALAGLAPVLAGVGGNLGGVNQAFFDALCGVADSGSGSCDMNIPTLDLEFVVDANAGQNCASVTMLSGGTVVGSVPMNLSNSGCLSGSLPDVPIEIGGTAGAFENVVVRMTVSNAGFSNGVMGATADSATAVAIAEALLEGAGAVVGQVYDINNDLSGDNDNGCNALSGTYTIGGVAQSM